MPILRVAGPVVEPVTLADLKLQLGLSPIEDTDHVKSDRLAKQLRRYITAARQSCENYTRRVFITQTWRLSLDHWPCKGELYAHEILDQAIVLPKPPFQSLSAFTYTDLCGNLQNIVAPVLGSSQTQPGSNVPTNFTDAPWGCQIDPGSETQRCRLLPPWPISWPPALPVLNSINITFVCGYGPTGSAVLPVMTQAILFLAQFYYENGGATDVPIPRVVANLLNPYRNRTS